MSKFTEIDFWFTDDGDLDVDASGDLRDTNGTLGRAVLQEIRDRLKSKRGEWKLNTGIGSSIESFLGEPGTTARIDQAVAEIERALTFDRMLLAGEVEVVPLQLKDSIVLFRVIVHTREGELSAQIGYDSDTQRFIGY